MLNIYDVIQKQARYSSQLENQISTKDSELVIGLVGAVGTDLSQISEKIKKRLTAYSYKTRIIRVSHEIISQFFPPVSDEATEYERISTYMDYGDKLRDFSQNDSVLVDGIANIIFYERKIDKKFEVRLPKKRTAYVIHSLKHPLEVQRLREIYKNGFYLIGVFTETDQRLENLQSIYHCSEPEALHLMHRDENEGDHGQQTRDTFQMSDFFIHNNGVEKQIDASITRIFDLLFGKPWLTPTHDEYAMFLAYCAALRSADLSRQIGAVISKNNDIISSGANDCPCYGGGLYWPVYDDKHGISDITGGRDWTRGYDSNKEQLRGIINDIIDKLNANIKDENKELIVKTMYETRLNELTEYGRIVHAEMEALLMCARNGISTRGATLYCTTMPCHNCAKHIIASGISTVYFIEPYPKSKTFEFYDDAIEQTQKDTDSSKVRFSHFIGVGPRRFMEIFLMKPVEGYDIIRKEKDGRIVEWSEKNACLRQQMALQTYLDREAIAADRYDKMGGEQSGDQEGV